MNVITIVIAISIVITIVIIIVIVIVIVIIIVIVIVISFGCASWNCILGEFHFASLLWALLALVVDSSCSSSGNARTVISSLLSRRLRKFHRNSRRSDGLNEA